MEATKYDVFISYRRLGGKEHARNVQLALQKETDWKVFLDFDDLDEGRFDPKIMAAIEEAPTFIVVLTSGALDRCAKENDWMRKEILYAHQLGKDIIPLEVDKCYHDDKMSTIPKIVGEIIGTYQFAVLDTEMLFRESIEKLIDRIRKGGKKIKKDSVPGAIIHVVNDYPCWVYHYRKEMLLAKTEEDNVLHLRRGKHLMEFKAVDYPQVRETKKVEIIDENREDMVEVNLKEKVEAIQRKKEEQRIAEEQKRREEEEKPNFTVEGVSFKMIRVEGGDMGTFYIGETQVTQALWQVVMGNNPSSFKFKGLGNPVERISWNDICGEDGTGTDPNCFLFKLNLKTGKNFRLPKEAEWEYAAMGGNKSKNYIYAGSDDIDKVAWYDGNSKHQTHTVKRLSPNELGVYDMSGNVCEWCEDLYDSKISDRVLRGGSWSYNARSCRVSGRDGVGPDIRRNIIGFRLVLPK